MKKIYKYLISIFIVLVIIIGFVQYKFISAENAVLEYLIENEGVLEDSIESEPFIANLSGDKNWMVSVNIKNDPRSYYYYLNHEKKVVLESYTENGVENVLNQIMN
ncbi:hypothetical protein QMK38_08220 [Lysinibacillus fusiformis]|nr:hypothetical protein [Lysinibacillus fusiformis]